MADVIESKRVKFLKWLEDNNFRVSPKVELRYTSPEFGYTVHATAALQVPTLFSSFGLLPFLNFPRSFSRFVSAQAATHSGRALCRVPGCCISKRLRRKHLIQLFRLKLDEIVVLRRFRELTVLVLVLWLF